MHFYNYQLINFGKRSKITIYHKFVFRTMLMNLHKQDLDQHMSFTEHLQHNCNGRAKRFRQNLSPMYSLHLSDHHLNLSNR